MAIREVHLTSQTVASERFGPFLCFGFLIFYKLNYLQPWVIAGGFFYVKIPLLYGWIGIHQELSVLFENRTRSV
jgi:hypothetical protein